MKLDVRTAAGSAASSIDVDDAVFGIEPNTAVVHQALVAQLAARRAGSANTKTRGEVRGSTHKTRRQKGLGMSRIAVDVAHPILTAAQRYLPELTLRPAMGDMRGLRWVKHPEELQVMRELGHLRLKRVAYQEGRATRQHDHRDDGAVRRYLTQRLERRLEAAHAALRCVVSLRAGRRLEEPNE